MDPVENILGINRKIKGLDYCPQCGRKVGRGNYTKEGCSECAYLSDELY